MTAFVESFSPMMEAYAPQLTAFACACVGTYVLVGKLRSPNVHTRQERHKLSRTPEKNRLVELGLGESEYLRMGLDYTSALKIFLTANLELEEKMDATEIISRVRRGLEHCQRLHPVLRCRLVKLPGNGRIVLEEDSDLKLNLHVYVDRDYREVFEEAGERRLMPVGRHAPSPHACWVFLCTKSNKLQLALDFAHFAFDGSGLGPVMHEFLTATFEPSQVPVEYGAWPEVQEVALQRVVDTQLSFLLRAWKRFKAFLVPLEIVAFNENISLPRDDSAWNSELTARFHTLCLFECFSEQETKQLLAKCRENKVSITSAVAAVFTEEMCKRVELQRAFSAGVVFVADSRGFCDPVVPASDLAPHVLALPAYFTEKKLWHKYEATAQTTWQHAQRMRQYITNTVSDVWFCRLYAIMVAFFLAFQPTNYGVPMVQVSSWSAKSPVKRRYASAVKVERVELLQNMSTTSWLNLSMYTMVDRLTVSMFTPVPRFNEQMTREIFQSSIVRIRELLSS